MDADTRRSNLKSLIDSRFSGLQRLFAEAMNMTEGRVAQLLAPESVFGERVARRIETALGLAPLALDKRPPAQTGALSPQHQDLSLAWNETPLHVKWGAIASMAKMPAEFQTTLPDNAMAPRAPAGAVVTFHSADTAQGGDGILVRDGRGRVYFREYRVKADGSFVAHAEDPAFPSLDSVGDELTIIGVFAGIRIGWSQLRR